MIGTRLEDTKEMPPDIDWTEILSSSWQWLLEQIISLAVLEALGISAIVTIIVSWFSQKIGRWRDKAAMCGLSFIAILIAINSFGYRTPKPYLHLDVGQISSGGSSDNLSPQDSFVFIGGMIRNRGTIQGTVTSISISIKLNDKWIKATPFIGPKSVVLAGESKDLNQAENWCGGHLIMVPVGIPIYGYCCFQVKNVPSSDFGGHVFYKVEVIDSFGSQYSRVGETHGELMIKPLE